VYNIKVIQRMFGPFSPIARTCSISSFFEEEQSSIPGTPKSPKSPKIDKLVGYCKNCAHSFRVKQTNSGEFCSKDCETCFTIFYNHISPFPSMQTNVNKPQEKKNTQEVRLSILHFQQQMDAKDNLMKTPPITPIADQSNHMVQNTSELILNELEYEQYKSEKKRLKQQVNDMNTTPFPLDNTTTPTAAANKESNDTMFGKIANTLFFTSPKPLRPQLHAFF